MFTTNKKLNIQCYKIIIIALLTAIVVVGLNGLRNEGYIISDVIYSILFMFWLPLTMGAGIYIIYLFDKWLFED